MCVCCSNQAFVSLLETDPHWDYVQCRLSLRRAAYRPPTVSSMTIWWFIFYTKLKSTCEIHKLQSDCQTAAQSPGVLGNQVPDGNITICQVRDAWYHIYYWSVLVIYNMGYLNVHVFKCLYSLWSSFSTTSENFIKWEKKKKHKNHNYDIVKCGVLFCDWVLIAKTLWKILTFCHTFMNKCLSLLWLFTVIIRIY